MNKFYISSVILSIIVAFSACSGTDTIETAEAANSDSGFEQTTEPELPDAAFFVEDKEGYLVFWEDYGVWLIHSKAGVIENIEHPDGQTYDSEDICIVVYHSADISLKQSAYIRYSGRVYKVPGVNLGNDKWIMPNAGATHYNIHLTKLTFKEDE
jgi:hypothetical protein